MSDSSSGLRWADVPADVAGDEPPGPEDFVIAVIILAVAAFGVFWSMA